MWALLFLCPYRANPLFLNTWGDVHDGVAITLSTPGYIPEPRWGSQNFESISIVSNDALDPEARAFVDSVCSRS